MIVQLFITNNLFVGKSTPHSSIVIEWNNSWLRLEELSYKCNLIWGSICYLNHIYNRIFTSVLTGRTETSNNLSVWRRNTFCLLELNLLSGKFKFSLKLNETSFLKPITFWHMFVGTHTKIPNNTIFPRKDETSNGRNITENSIRTSVSSILNIKNDWIRNYPKIYDVLNVK